MSSNETSPVAKVNSLRKSQQELFKSMRRISSPFAAFQTHDQDSLVKDICEGALGVQGVRVTWDQIRGFLGVNDPGIAYVSKLKDPEMTAIPSLLADLLILANEETEFPEKGCLFIYNAHVFFDEKRTDRNLIIAQLQHLANLFRSGYRTIVFMCSYLNIPVELQYDITVFPHSYPDDEEIIRIIDKIYTIGKVPLPSKEFKESLLPELRALPPKGAETHIALSMRPDGVMLEQLRELREVTFQRKGLSVYRDTVNFSDLGGLKGFKYEMDLLFHGSAIPQVVGWIDEGEKDMSPAALKGDNTGTTPDQLKVILEYMENYKMLGCLLLGITGTGKSFSVKALGKQYGVRVLKLDLGGNKQKELGSSETHIRENMELFRSLGRDRVLFMMTCNDISAMPAELLRRFGLARFFFDLPTEEEKAEIWTICKSQFGIKDTILPDDTGYSQDDIYKTCWKAALYRIPLIQAAKSIQATEILHKDENRNRRNFAVTHGLLSASYPGLYKMPVNSANKVKEIEQKISFEEVN